MPRRFGNIIDAVAKVLRLAPRHQIGTYTTEQVEYSGLPFSAARRLRGSHHRYDLTGCVGCECCARSCPGGCIHVGKERVPGRRGLQITSFSIDYARCLACGMCTELCPAGCIVMGSSRELSRHRREGCVVDFSRLPVEAAWGSSRPDRKVAARCGAVTRLVRALAERSGGGNGS